jgi:hypothetical protein
MYSLALIIFVVSEKKAFEHFPIGSNVNLCIAVVAILDFRSAYKTEHPGMIIGRSSTRCVFYADRKSKMATTAGHIINIGSYGKMFKCLLLRNYKYD